MRRSLAWTAAVYTLVLIALWFGFAERLGRVGFYALFALTVTMSVQLVGLYLVFATLIVPPLATRRMARRRLVAAWSLGLAGLCGRPRGVDGARPTDRPGHRLGTGGSCARVAGGNAATPTCDRIAAPLSCSVNGTKGNDSFAAH